MHPSSSTWFACGQPTVVQKLDTNLHGLSCLHANSWPSPIASPMPLPCFHFNGSMFGSMLGIYCLPSSTMEAHKQNVGRLLSSWSPYFHDCWTEGSSCSNDTNAFFVFSLSLSAVRPEGLDSARQRKRCPRQTMPLPYVNWQGRYLARHFAARARPGPPVGFDVPSGT